MTPVVTSSVFALFHGYLDGDGNVTFELLALARSMMRASDKVASVAGTFPTRRGRLDPFVIRGTRLSAAALVDEGGPLFLIEEVPVE